VPNVGKMPKEMWGFFLCTDWPKRASEILKAEKRGAAASDGGARWMIQPDRYMTGSGDHSRGLNLSRRKPSETQAENVREKEPNSTGTAQVNETKDLSFGRKAKRMDVGRV